MIYSTQKDYHEKNVYIERYYTSWPKKWTPRKLLFNSKNQRNLFEIALRLAE